MADLKDLTNRALAQYLHSLAVEAGQDDYGRPDEWLEEAARRLFELEDKQDKEEH